MPYVSLLEVQTKISTSQKFQKKVMSLECSLNMCMRKARKKMTNFIPRKAKYSVEIYEIAIFVRTRNFITIVCIFLVHSLMCMWAVSNLSEKVKHTSLSQTADEGKHFSLL